MQVNLDSTCVTLPWERTLDLNWRISRRKASRGKMSILAQDSRPETWIAGNAWFFDLASCLKHATEVEKSNMSLAIIPRKDRDLPRGIGVSGPDASGSATLDRADFFHPDLDFGSRSDRTRGAHIRAEYARKGMGTGQHLPSPISEGLPGPLIRSPFSGFPGAPIVSLLALRPTWRTH